MSVLNDKEGTGDLASHCSRENVFPSVCLLQTLAMVKYCVSN